MLFLVKIFVLAYNPNMTLEQKVARLLIKQGKTLAIGESCSGGLLSHRLTNVPGSSRFLKAALVTYSNEAKSKLLKVPQALLKKHGAVSEQTALMMAKGARTLMKSDFGLSITGIAGPDGGSKTKPVGLTFIALSTPHESLCLKCTFKGSRHQIKSKSTTQALKLLLNFLA